MDLFLPIIIVIIAAFVLFLVTLKKKDSHRYPYQLSKYLLSKAERSFYGVLSQVIGDSGLIFTKVRIADVLSPGKSLDRSNWQKAFNAISSKHFDFLICDPRDCSILLAVELDDSSHDSAKSKKRDKIVNDACASAALPLLRVKASKSYSTADIRDRINRLSPLIPSPESKNKSSAALRGQESSPISSAGDETGLTNVAKQSPLATKPASNDQAGYVYVLEVADIDLPVSKIGMTTRNPLDRCKEINNSSTGDFIWAVAHSIYVSDCKSLETLVHTKLTPMRQKRREFFNVSAANAYAALVSILESQESIRIIDLPDTPEEVNKSSTKPVRAKKQHSFRAIDSQYASLLDSFSSVLNIKGRPFGQLNAPTFGISDGNVGVQWNLAVNPNTENAYLGVNLEGSAKTGGWLISNLIRSELEAATLDTLASRVPNPENISLRFSRDAWQGAARLNIKEKFLGGKLFNLSELNAATWHSLLEEALTCLDPEKDYKGRRLKQVVTLVSDGRKVEKNLSPHLTIWSNISSHGDSFQNIEAKVAELQPVYDWMKKTAADR